MTESTRKTLKRYCVEFARTANADQCEAQCVFAHTETEAIAILAAELSKRGVTHYICDVYEG